MNEKKAIWLLKRHAKTQKAFRCVLAHSISVKNLSLEIAKKINKNKKIRKKADLKFIKVACLLHDIGRFYIPPGSNSGAHGYVGGQVLRKEGLDDRFVRVCETHVGYWITKSNVSKLKMKIPKKSYKPKGIEEKIISYADKRASGKRIVPIENVLKRYEKELGIKHSKRILTLHNQIQRLMQK